MMRLVWLLLMHVAVMPLITNFPNILLLMSIPMTTNHVLRSIIIISVVFTRIIYIRRHPVTVSSRILHVVLVCPRVTAVV